MTNITRILQINLNRSWKALDLLKQNMFELNVGIALISEPPKGLKESNACFISNNGLAAILWRSEDTRDVTCRLIRRGNNFVIVLLGDVYLISSYISRNSHMDDFSLFLDLLGGSINSLNGQLLLLGGDFNAHSHLWGSMTTDRRGELLIRWAATYELRILNLNGVHTCIRPQGSSIIDLTWASPALLALVDWWGVLDSVESLSDHLYIQINIKTHKLIKDNNRVIRKRWNFKKLDTKLFTQIIEFQESMELPCDCADHPEYYVNRVVKIIENACNVAAPLVSSINKRRQMYWWSEEIYELRRNSVRARRRWTKSKKKNNDLCVTNFRNEYKQAKKRLRNAIRRSKNKAWYELISSIERDPWGLPYKLVMGKLRRTSPTLAETLDLGELDALLNSLFPKNIINYGSRTIDRLDWDDNMEVNVLDVANFIRKRPAKNTAPGPDNFKMVVWKKAPSSMYIHLANIFTLCFKHSVFPEVWKKANLVLLPKLGGSPGSIKARPICLLDEMGKILERIIAMKINQWLDNNEEFSLSDNQYGFRKGRSTVDALFRVCSYVKPCIGNNGYAIAVGLDIANAFNSVPWETILVALERKHIPIYLRKIIASYLSARKILYKDASGRLIEREVSAGVPQGSVLGPLLWNIAFDSVLELGAEEGCHTVCYADDTLLITTSDRLYDAIIKANIQIARTIRHILKLGLTVAENKTEAVLFCKRKPQIMPLVRVGQVSVQVSGSMKYLGVIVDSCWNFKDHLDYINKKIAKATRALSRLMPNLRGPGERKRQFYSNVLTSIAMYAAPVWCRALDGPISKNARAIRGLQRTVALRVTASYRTVSFDAATLLARMPPWFLDATFRGRLYDRIRGLISNGEYSSRAEAEVREQEYNILIRQWIIFLDRPNSWGQTTTKAIGPHFRKWLDRKFGEINYYGAQMLTGHGSFGHYLWRMGKRENAACFHCSHDDDTVEHTLAVCPAWNRLRNKFKEDVSFDSNVNLTLDKVIDKILHREEYWGAFIHFATSVLKLKEEEERRRERASLSPSLS